MQDVYILSAARTPIGQFGGSLASLTAADMGVVAAKAAIERAGIRADQVDETIFGNARQAGGGPNPSRQISIRSGVPQEVPAFTVNKACASGLKSIALAYQSILLGDANCILAGGTESMSRLPYYLDGARWGYRLGNQELVDGMYRDGFFCPLARMVMGETAEVLAEQYKITRDEQDEYALMSQTRAARAIGGGRFDSEIVPVSLENKKGTTTLSRDEHPFADASAYDILWADQVVVRCEHGKACETGSRLLELWHHHRREFLGHHRWRGCCGDRGGPIRKAQQSEAAGTNCRRDLRRSRSSHYGHWPSPGAAQARGKT